MLNYDSFAIVYATSGRVIIAAKSLDPTSS